MQLDDARHRPCSPSCEALVEELPAADEAYLEQMELFVAALSKHGSTDMLLPRLTQLLDRQPNRKDLRLQLVDVLQSRGDFEEAELHLLLLMSKKSISSTPSYGRLISETSREPVAMKKDASNR